MTNDGTEATSKRHALTEKQQQAASMLASGSLEQEAADFAGVAKRTLQRWKKQHDFQLAIEEYRQTYSQAVVETIKQETVQHIVDEVRECRERYRHGTTALYDAAQMYLDKVKQKIELLDFQEISEAKLGQTLKQLADSLSIALQLNREFLGVDEVAEKIYEIQPHPKQNGIGEVKPVQRTNGTVGNN